jgi:AraC-like DNA-binding protein
MESSCFGQIQEAGYTPFFPAGVVSAPLLKRGTTPEIKTFSMPVNGPLSAYVTALVAAQVPPTDFLRLRVVPHEGFVLAIKLGGVAHGFDNDLAFGERAFFAAIREEPQSIVTNGDCTSLFAVLTPLAATRLRLHRGVPGEPDVRTPFAQLAGAHAARALEDRVMRSESVEDKLAAVGAWLEVTLLEGNDREPRARRTADAARALVANPHWTIKQLAEHFSLTIRPLEREFQRWLGVSPKRYTQVARVQQVARLAAKGRGLAAIAAELGFSDQAHLSRSVSKLTQLTPGQFIRSRQTALAATFRNALSGGVFYL